jgi:hypothetical protein
MTDASLPSSGTPREVLAGLNDLARRVRAAQRGTWFPLLLLGLLLLGGILVDRLTFHIHTVSCRADVLPDAVGCVQVKQGSPLYWTLGLALVYAVTAVFYISRARRRGVGSTVRPYLLVGLVVLALVAPTRFWGTGQVPPPGGLGDFWGLHFHATPGLGAFLSRLTGRAVSVGVPLLVLAWVERSRALLAFALVYLFVELLPVTAGRTQVGHTSPWSALPGLIVPAVLLLAGAAGFGWAERSRQRVAS